MYTEYINIYIYIHILLTPHNTHNAHPIHNQTHTHTIPHTYLITSASHVVFSKLPLTVPYLTVTCSGVFTHSSGFTTVVCRANSAMFLHTPCPLHIDSGLFDGHFTICMIVSGQLCRWVYVYSNRQEDPTAAQIHQSSIHTPYIYIYIHIQINTHTDIPNTYTYYKPHPHMVQSNHKSHYPCHIYPYYYIPSVLSVHP